MNGKGNFYHLAFTSAAFRGLILLSSDPGRKPEKTPNVLSLSQLCIELGWKPKYGRFDVVPLVLQANGQDPEIFEYPPEIVLEVPIEHPR